MQSCWIHLNNLFENFQKYPPSEIQEGNPSEGNFYSSYLENKQLHLILITMHCQTVAQIINRKLAKVIFKTVCVKGPSAFLQGLVWKNCINKTWLKRAQQWQIEICCSCCFGKPGDPTISIYKQEMQNINQTLVHEQLCISYLVTHLSQCSF